MTKTITANGNAQIDTAQSKFGGASGLFDGTGDCLSTPDDADFYFNGDFTIDFWVRFGALQNSMLYQHSQNESTDFFNLFFHNTAGGRLALNIRGSNAWILDCYIPFTASINTWYHVEVSREGNTWRMFINGVAGTKVLTSGAYTNTLPDYTGIIYIGMQSNSGTTLNGWLDEYRVSKGVARHTSNFTPETKQYVTDANTVLLLRMNGDDSSTTFIDESDDVGLRNNLISYWKCDESSGNLADAHGTVALTNNGTTPFGTGKINNAIDFGTTNTSKFFAHNARNIYDGTPFTVNLWVKIRTAPTTGENQIMFFSIDSISDTYPIIMYRNSGGTLQMYMGRSRFGVADDVVTDNQDLGTSDWHMLTVTYDGTNIEAFLDGVSIGTTTSSGNGSGATTMTRIGAWATGGDYAKSYVDEVGFWSRALSGSEITQLYNGGAGYAYPFTNTNETVLPVAQVVTSSIPSATIRAGLTTTPSAQTATFSIPAIALLLDMVLLQIAQTATFSVPTPNILTPDALIQPTAQTVTFSIPTADINLDFIIAIAGAVTGTFNLPTRAILIGATITPTAQTATFLLPAIGLILETVITANEVVATFSIPAYSIETATVISVNEQIATFNTNMPSFILDMVIEVDPVIATFITRTPAVVKASNYQTKYTMQNNTYGVKYT